jgi:hypothetical protein
VLAELHGKLVASQVVAVERSEDLLTDAVFGALRYLPYARALKAVLEAAGVEVAAAGFRDAEVHLWRQFAVPHWPGRFVEPDVVVVAGTTVVVFEAKLFSPFTQHHDPLEPAAPPLHQLAVQHAAVRMWALGGRLKEPVVVAVTADVARPEVALEQATRNAEHLTGHSCADSFRWLPWHSIAKALEGVAPSLARHERVHINDLLTLMEMRGVRRVFSGFQMEDYWLMAAAQRIAGARLYPELRAFFDELTSALGDDGIGWSQPGYKSMWLGGSSTSVSRPAEWSRSFVGGMYWPKEWPTRGKPGANLALYALFDFLNPAIEVGLSIPGPGVAAAQEKWSSQLEDLAGDLASLVELEIVVDAGDVARPAMNRPAPDVDVDWLRAACATLVGTAHLRVRRRSPVDSVTVQETRDTLRDLRARLDGCQAVWRLLRSTAHVTTPPTSSEAALTDTAEDQ